MMQARRSRTIHDKQRTGKNGIDTAMSLTDPFDLALYTPQYKQPDPPAKNFRDSDEAWTRFLAARPLLYLPDRSSITDEDPINRHRRLWTHQELQAFGDEVEERTRVQLRAQEHILRRWHQSAAHVQRCFRGMRDRMHVLRLRQELFEYAATLARAMELARERRRRRKAAVAIQREYRCHRKLVIRRQRAAIMLQNASKRFMQRLRRWKARLTMQRAARCFLWRLRWQQYRRRVIKMLNAAARQRKLAQTTKAFLHARENAFLQRQVNTWTAHPERMQMLLRARQRQQKLRITTGGTLPPLQHFSKQHNSPAKATRTTKSFSTSTKNQQDLPPVFPSINTSK